MPTPFVIPAKAGSHQEKMAAQPWALLLGLVRHNLIAKKTVEPYSCGLGDVNSMEVVVESGEKNFSFGLLSQKFF